LKLSIIVNPKIFVFSIKFYIKPIYMIKTKVAFLKGPLLSSQSEQYGKFLKTPDWQEKSRPSKKATLVLIM